MIERAGFNVLLLGGVLFAPWPLTVFVAFLFAFRFRAYELPVWGAVADALYGVSGLFGFPLFFTLLFSFLFVAIEYSKRFLVFY